MRTQHVIEGSLADERATLQAAEIQLARERETWTKQLESAKNNIAHAKAAQDLAEHACSTLDKIATLCAQISYNSAIAFKTNATSNLRKFNCFGRSSTNFRPRFN